MYKPSFLIIGEENDLLNDTEKEKIQHLNTGIQKNKHIFLFVFMNTCGPCIQTKPQWDNIQDHLEKKYENRDDFIIARLNYKFFDQLGNAGIEPGGFPTLRYVKNNNTKEYEDDGFSDRSTESFLKWITSKIENEKGDSKSRTKSSTKKSKKSSKYSKNSSKKTRKNSISSLFQTGGKWSMKYKKTINCKRPRGFSQRQHCKYGRKNWKSKK